MKRMILLILTVAVIGFNAYSQTPLSYKQQAWDLGNNLSNAALLNAMSDNTDLVQRTFKMANENAENLGITLPALPAKTHDKTENNATALYYLLNSTGKPIMKILTEDFGAEHAALFELSFKTNILLMLYEPDSKETAAIVRVIESRTATAQLPETAFSELLKLIAANSSYNEIRTEIFTLQRIISMFVALKEFETDGEAFYQQGDYAKSIVVYSQALKVNPDDPKFHYLRARSYLQSDKCSEAIIDYTNAIRYSKADFEKANLPAIYHNRGLCYGILKKYTPAVADLTSAIKLDPEYASAYKIRSILYRQLGNTKLADADYRKAESLQPGIMK